MPRRAKPIELHLIDGKKHLTKKEIEYRKKTQIRIGAPDKLKMPPEIKNDDIAKKKYRQIKKIFDDSNTNLITNADQTTIARYCLLWSNYIGLQERRNNFIRVLEEVDLPGNFWSEDLEKLEKLIDQKNKLLLSMEDRLFLNPLARVKNIPKKETKNNEVDPLKQAGFGNV